jgi:hypothetical protein
MVDAVIERFETRFRLPADPAASMVRRAAVETPLRSMLDQHLDAALARLALDDEIVLVKSLRTSIRLGRGVTAWQAGVGWSEAIVAALEQRLREPDPGEVLRFRRRLDALAAFVDCALEERSDRDWAWRQLDFLPPSVELASAAERLAAVPDAMVAEPDHLPALLRLLARHGRVADLAVASEAGAVDALVWAMAQAIGVAAPAGAVPSEAIARARLASPPAMRATVAGRSFLRAVLATRADRAAWARLAALTLEPHRLFVGRAELNDLAARWLALAEDTAHGGPATSASDHPETSPEGGFAQPRSAEDPSGDRRSQTTDPRPRPSPVGGRTGREGRPDSTASPDAPPAPRPGARSRTPLWTRFGGLMLLAPVVAESGAGERLFDVDDDQRLRARLHALSLRLAEGAEPDDPAALAFAGLDPDADPPAGDPAERTEIEAAAQRVGAWLAQRLPDWKATGRVTRVIGREAMILSEPGWVEVEFALADVDPAIRRAGLDLDPGYLPWLGLVLKYRYV